jgi:hypothetical protein
MTHVLRPPLIVDTSKPAAKRAAEEAQRDALAHQRELAFDLFGRLPLENVRAAKTWKFIARDIARTIAGAFDRSVDEMLRKLPKWRKEFLRSRDGD